MPAANASRPGLDPALEALALRFEQAWQAALAAGNSLVAPALADYLPADLPPNRRLKALKELIKVDMEFRLRSPLSPLGRGVGGEGPASLALVEKYLQRHPELNLQGKFPLDLIAEEYRARHRWSDRPAHAEYEQRFPEHAADLPAALNQIDESLAAEFPRLSIEKQAAVSNKETLPPGEPSRARVVVNVHETPTVTGPGNEAIVAVPINSEAASLLPQIPGYEILGVLGRGGMGAVYKTRHFATGRLVAVKVIGGQNPSAHERLRFDTEAKALARLDHPNIVRIYDVGEHQGQPFLALELVSGGNLKQKLAVGLPTPNQAAKLVETLARAVQAAHHQDLVHRDLKPHNILLAGPTEAQLEQCIPKITDFGLAKCLDVSVGPTMSGAVLGTPSYMAPEQAEGRTRDIGPLVDVYSLGAILYELLTGQPPFQAETPLDTILKVISENPLPPSQVRHDVPRQVERICLKCLQKEPLRRYPSAESLAEDLLHFQKRCRPVKSTKASSRLIVALSVLMVSAAAIAFMLNRGDDRPKLAEDNGHLATKELQEAEVQAPPKSKDAEKAASNSSTKPPSKGAASVEVSKTNQFFEPQLVFLGTDDYQSAKGVAWTRYKLSVLNRSALPDDMFHKAPDLPAAGLNKNASRTWVNIFTQNGQKIQSFVAIGSAESLSRIHFAVQKGTVPPSAVYLELFDRRLNLKHKSNLLPIPSPKREKSDHALPGHTELKKGKEPDQKERILLGVLT